MLLSTSWLRWPRQEQRVMLWNTLVLQFAICQWKAVWRFLIYLLRWVHVQVSLHRMRQRLLTWKAASMLLKVQTGIRQWNTGRRWSLMMMQYLTTRWLSVLKILHRVSHTVQTLVQVSLLMELYLHWNLFLQKRLPNLNRNLHICSSNQVRSWKVILWIMSSSEPAPTDV